MKRTRVIETNEGIQAEATVVNFNLMQRGHRDRGLLETQSIIKNGLNNGIAIEIGPGPGYLGLEWLKATKNTKLVGIEISKAMIQQAEKNRNEYNLTTRAEYKEGNAMSCPFEENTFDNAFSNGSLHEWENPLLVLSEIYRVLKPGGKLFISDLKRNSSLPVTIIMKSVTKGKAMKKGLITSIEAAYTKEELLRMCEWSVFENFSIKESPFGLELTAEK
ncbi:MAG: class I SAM-dependent methyltransferase [Spirochaetales bacterium]|nr:class I SAM-dependent methyltransferase [Spirochaetales bacterium]